MDENIPCCRNCKFAFGNNENLYCSKVGFKADEYAACFMYEQRQARKEKNNEKTDSNR